MFNIDQTGSEVFHCPFYFKFILSVFISYYKWMLIACLSNKSLHQPSSLIFFPILSLQIRCSMTGTCTDHLKIYKDCLGTLYIHCSLDNLIFEDLLEHLQNKKHQYQEQMCCGTMPTIASTAV